MGFKRWYDQDPKFGEVVRAMEFMTLASRKKFAVKLLELTEELIERHGGGELFASLDPEQKISMEKAETNRRRWYDQIDELHEAFKNLYALKPTDRREIAMKFSTPIQLVGAYEVHCNREGREPVPRIIEEILWTSLLENGGEKRARKLYGFYLYDYSAYVAGSSPALEEPLPAATGGFWATLLSSLQNVLAAA